MNKEAIQKWTQLELEPQIAEQLVANQFTKPTEVQAQSLLFLQQRIDLVIAAKTGQGKTLTFALPILDQLVKKIHKWEEIDEADREKSPFTSVKALIISPTRELAIQIKDMINDVIPMDYQEHIKTCCLVGGMSIQKQQRLLSYNPAIVIATPGRLWELMDDVMEPYLVGGLPMIDFLVLDEADRMVADGHFRELDKILGHIYTKRVEIKKQAKSPHAKQELGESTKQILEEQDVLKTGKNFKMGANQQKGATKVDLSKMNVVDLEDDLEGDDMQDLVIDLGEKEIFATDTKERANQNRDKTKMRKEQRIAEEAKEQRAKEQFDKDYQKLGGIQHIVCSATMTIDNAGRVTPRQQKYLKKKGLLGKEQESTLDCLCKRLKFRSKNPKVIDMNEEEGQNLMPSTLSEYLVRCKQDEKDLYLYYFLQQHRGESVVVFCNAITAVRRLTSLLDFLKIKNHVLHSKMQQKQRLKNLDRFKRGVNTIEAGDNSTSAILVCTDVAARGLDIPYVQNVVHYQCPFNAETYIHRSGRTARIGRTGIALAVLNPEDNKAFRGICIALKKNEDGFDRYEVQYSLLDKIRPLIEQAKDLEKTLHQKNQNEKQANRTLLMAEEADLELDEDMQNEISEQLGKKSKRSALLKDSRNEQFKDDGEIRRKRESKQQQKEMAMKANYNKEVEAQKMKKFSNSSFLTPEAAMYLADVVKANQSKVDDEVIYAGLHEAKLNKKKFDKNEKFSTKYTKRRTNKRKKKGRFG